MDIKYTKEYYLVFVDEECRGTIFPDEELAYNYACDMNKSGHKVQMERTAVAELDF